MLNDWARRELPNLAHEGIQLYCVTGLGKGAAEVLALKTADRSAVTAVFMPFSDQVAALLSAADLVVARAGAGSIAEMIRCETPSVVIPYPHAADDHQRANALWFGEHGGAVVIGQAQLQADLGREVRSLLADDARLAGIRANLRRLDRASPLSAILDDLESFNSGAKTAT